MHTFPVPHRQSHSRTRSRPHRLWERQHEQHELRLQGSEPASFQPLARSSCQQCCCPPPHIPTSGSRSSHFHPRSPETCGRTLAPRTSFRWQPLPSRSNSFPRTGPSNESQRFRCADACPWPSRSCSLLRRSFGSPLAGPSTAAASSRSSAPFSTAGSAGLWPALCAVTATAIAFRSHRSSRWLG